MKSEQKSNNELRVFSLSTVSILLKVLLHKCP